MSSSIRPRRTGLIVFSSRIVSVFTGLLFLVMISRWLTPSMFGLWGLLTTIIAFSAYPTGVITYWATREVARGRLVGRTALLTNQVASLLGTGLYLVVAYLTYTQVNAGTGPFILSAVLVPLAYWTQASAALASGYDPAINGYSLYFSEPAKLILAYPLLYVFRLGIYGVIVSIAVSYLAQGIYTTYRLRPASSDRFDFSQGLRWLEDWHVPTLVSASSLLIVAGPFAASIGQGGTSLAGYYQAAFQVAVVVTYSSYLSVALYPLLLRNASERLPGEVLEFSLLFAIPMTAGAIALAPNILYILRPEYVASSPALAILSLSAVAGLVSVVMDQSLTGRENADLAETDRTKRILGSDLLFVAAVNLVVSAAYAVVVFVLGYTARGGGEAIPQLASYWALAQFGMWFVIASVKVVRLRSRARFSLSRSVWGYLGCGLLMGLVVNVIGTTVLTTGLHASEYGLRLVLLVILGAAVYFGLLSSFDKNVRNYAAEVLKSIR